MINKKLNVALVGLRFGGAFVSIWYDHPDVERLGVCDFDANLTKEFVKRYPKLKVYGSLDEILEDGSIDAVHLVTCIPDHAEQTVAVLNSGKHCACTVPMATTLQGIRDICAAVRRNQKKYMMMETTLYTYHFRYVRKLIESGEFGRVQFLRGSHYQDMEHWPLYWNGLPPFWYGTHALGPLVALSESRVERVSCLGSGTMRKEHMTTYGNPFPIETVHLRFANGLAGEATRSLFETARMYKEGLAVYGSLMSFEWGFEDHDLPYITKLLVDDKKGQWDGRGTPARYEQIEMPNDYSDLPEVLWKYTVGSDRYDATNPQESLKTGAGAGHHGSHAHLVHEFVSSIIEDRRPWIDEELSGNITAAGICAHESALRDGEWITVPRF
ncbi:MAG: Gfo/Idh/MocA family oxidoreductase [Clostridia bacterium]|nr:Gfo/Idh/MocA family oxidoreductase [Clostridia bacterium]